MHALTSFDINIWIYMPTGVIIYLSFSLSKEVDSISQQQLTTKKIMADLNDA